MDADLALQMLGKYSKWQLRSYLFYAFGFGVPFAWMVMSIVFIGDTPDYRCALEPNVTLNQSIPLICDDNNNCKYDKCHMYRNFSKDNTTEDCRYGYWYDPSSGYESTLVTEFDLVCGKNWLVEFSMTINSVGALIGTILFPLLCDALGRKKIFLFCMWSNILIAFVQAFSVNMWMYIALGFLDGFQQQGMIISAAVLSMELFPKDQRTFAGVAIEFFWAMGYVSIVPIAYFIRNWRYLQIAITAPLVLTIIFYWYISESVPWLVLNDKKHLAEEILRKAAKYNNITNYPDHIFSLQEEELNDLILGKNCYKPSENTTEHEAFISDGGKEDSLQQSKGKSSSKKLVGLFDKMQTITTKNPTKENSDEIPKYKVWDIFRSKKILLYSVLQCFIWMINALGYLAMSLTVTYLPGNRYLNVLLYSLMEIPAYIVLWITLHVIGRRIPISFFHVLGGLALIGTIVQSYEWGSHLPGLLITLSVIGKFCFCCTFGGIYVHSLELYPTNLRGTGLGLCSLFSKVGSFIAPYFRLLARDKPFLPYVIIGICSVLAGIMELMLPETRYEPLATTIEQVEHFNRRVTRKKQEPVNEHELHGDL